MLVKLIPDLLLDVPILVDVLGHQVEELVEADATVAVLVDFTNHFLRKSKKIIFDFVVQNIEPKCHKLLSLTV
jgi:hypothetical protein